MTEPDRLTAAPSTSLRLAALPRAHVRPPRRNISQASIPSSARRWKRWRDRLLVLAGAGTGKTRVLTAASRTS